MTKIPALTTPELLQRLERHYIKPGTGLAGGIFVHEVGFNGNFGASQRCDAIYAGFTSASGRLLIGHELKVSRADWLTELSKPGKADAWADQCHEWWLVTLPGVVHPGELPEGWGLMIPGTSKTRMKIVTPAHRHLDRTPSWDAVRSVMARQDTLRAQAIHAAQQDALRKARETIAEEVARRVQSALAGSGVDDAAVEELRLYREALGGKLVDDASYRWGTSHTMEDLKEMAHLLRTHRDLESAVSTLTGQYGALQDARKAFEELDRIVAAATEPLKPQHGTTTA